MKDYFDIFGTPIKYSSIKDFRIVQREYIYRPAYVETVVTEQKFMKKTISSKYVFEKMLPYAAIVDESDRRSAFNSIRTNTFGESIGKEVFSDIRETIGDKFNIKAIKAKKYKCTNESGRLFYVYLDEIPVLVVSAEGKFTDVTKEDPLYQLIEGSTMPAVNMIHALLIHADQVYLFYGNGIQIDNVQEEYQRLQNELQLYNQEKKESKRLIGKIIPESIEAKPSKEMLPLPKLSIPTFKRNDKGKDSKEQRIAEVKKQLENGVISEEDYRKLIEEIIDSI